MKGILVIFIAGLLTIFTSTSTAQVKVDVKKKVARETNQRANQRTDQAIDKGLDKLEEGIGSIFKKKDQSSEESKSEKEEPVLEKKTPPIKSKKPAEEILPVPEEQPKPQLIWAKYDFVPGTEIIFEDNLEGEQNGEFPSKWDLKAGTVEIANLDGDNIIWFRKSGSKITPLIKEKYYLPEEFTIEFDYQMLSSTQHHYTVEFLGADGRYLAVLNIGGRGASLRVTKSNGDFSGNINSEFIPGLKHAAISFNKRSLKYYSDDQRVLNIPNVNAEIKSFNISSGLGSKADEAKSLIKNIKVAKGAVPLYDKFLTDGKFVTTGIKFDVNKATIKPESMGTINYVVKMMTDHPELKFSVEGHTDSDGEDAANLKLSEARAKSVLEAMTKLGIAADRLTSKGHGESKPMAGNDTPEGKAQNRRVEFVKF